MPRLLNQRTYSVGTPTQDAAIATDNGSMMNPKQMNTATLEVRCRQETHNFLQNHSYEPSYGYELFRRALEEQDELAWTAIVQVYDGLVAKWVRQHPKFPLTNEDASYFVNRAFERLWRYVGRKAGKFSQFRTLAAILQYLKMCVNGAVIDDGLRLPPTTISVEAWPEDNPAALPALEIDFTQPINQNGFWQLIEARLRTEKEKIAIYGCFLHGMKPAEIYVNYSHIFASARQISNTKTTVLRRLARLTDLEELLKEFVSDCKHQMVAQWA